MPKPLLPQQPMPVDRRQAALTARFLLPVEAALLELLLELRSETDRDLGGQLAARSGKAYPLGRCWEISQDVVNRLQARIVRPKHRAEKAIHSFLKAGGVARSIWGALREQYFQNALQLGALYVDVANDTVTVTKPKIEIVPMSDSGFAAIRGPEHFAVIARSYWGAQVYANHVVPSLAPILPIITLTPGEAPALQSATDYMIDLCRRDGFAQAEAWLVSAPAPPAAVVDALRTRCPADLLPPDPHAGGDLAVAACRAARAAGMPSHSAWRDARVADYLRIHPGHTTAARAAEA